MSIPTNNAGDLASWKERAERAEAALEQLRSGIEANADQIEPALERIDANVAAVGRQLWRGDGLVTAADIALHELEQDGQLQPHTHALLRSAVATYKAGRTEGGAG